MLCTWVDPRGCWCMGTIACPGSLYAAPALAPTILATPQACSQPIVSRPTPHSVLSQYGTIRPMRPLHHAEPQPAKAPYLQVLRAATATPVRDVRSEQREPVPAGRPQRRAAARPCPCHPFRMLLPRRELPRPCPTPLSTDSCGRGALQQGHNV